MKSAKPAAGNGGHREIAISDWKPHSKGSLKGFFSASLPSGLILHSLMLHQKGDARWIGFPAREWTNAEGVKQFAKLVEFTTRAVADKFRDSVLAALDAHRESQS